MISTVCRGSSVLILLIPLLLLFSIGAVGGDGESEAIRSHVVITDAEERVLIEVVIIDAAVADVWAAYVTDEGWTGWASPKANIDLRCGGTILTHYGQDAEIGDPGTNTLHIVSYVPERLLTLRAELAPNWPEIMKEDADNMSNVILFEEISPTQTRLTSYGIGYQDAPEYDTLLEFFAQANAGLYRKLKRFVEDGERASFK